MTIKRRDFNKLIGAAAISPVLLSQPTKAETTWSFEANVAECCSCEIPCPCNFGLPTKLRCDGNRLIEIEKGNIGDMDLAGVRFLVSFEMGKWARIYLDDKMNNDQMEAFKAIFPVAFAGYSKQARSVEVVPLEVTRQDDLVLKYKTPASEVEMKPLRGIDGGLITVDGLPNKAFYHYVQYESVDHTHDDPDRQWSYSGTNGFTSRMIVSG
ncbi:MAG: DUF1326 domain-containing protein [Emcibacteraceae bacterium]